MVVVIDIDVGKVGCDDVCVSCDCCMVKMGLVDQGMDGDYYDDCYDDWDWDEVEDVFC